MNPTVTLLISTYNRPDFLKAVLTTVVCQSVMPEQIVIADDGSREDTKELIDSFRSILLPPIVHVWHADDGFRKTQILNKALKVCRGEYIVQIDGDILLHPQFIEDHISEAKHGFFIRGSRALVLEDHTMKIVRGEIGLSPDKIQKGVKRKMNGVRIPLIAWLFCRKSNDVRHIKGCNFAFWKEDMIRVNGYNNDLSGWGHEDIEVAARLFNSGVKIKRVKFKAVCFHLYHSFNSRSQEDSNLKVYETTIRECITKCENGYNMTD